ncbi:MAG TPA: 1-acyl-sn-glycerol-3-phosphate acyltransferase [Candidatus Hydrogenedentes bacterium]|nr:1-acyl-sn-glycerol-3-phosphate acyltransferase [Candidatus Hydrogenedentota bacterium]HRK34487.1 1-acyl-sn-glycerol-3-phosphate acyltransferase [Candidatus Hydrogenedentota bacterium]
MRELRAWIVLGWAFVRYFSYRLGLGACPSFLAVYPEAVMVFDRIMKWPARLRVEGAENCPRSGPAVFSANHFAKDDPFIMYRAIHRLCEGSYPVRFMMRDDFFKSLGGVMKSRILDVDELARLVGSLQISRDRVQLSQLKPFMTLLREAGSFIMYPGRSRSRTGVFIEYRDGIEEPGGVTFLIAQAQRGRPDLRVPAIPMARTLNLVTRKSAIVFGPSIYLAHDADRTAQRDMDFRLIELMGDLVEVNAAHFVAGTVYLHCLHHRSCAIVPADLELAIAAALGDLAHRRVDPALFAARRQEIEAAFVFFEAEGLVVRSGAGFAPIRDRVLATPPHDTTYRTLNPVKYTVNQVLHLLDVTEAIEQVFLKVCPN